MYDLDHFHTIIHTIESISQKALTCCNWNHRKSYLLVGGAIQKYVNSEGFTVIPAFTGHGIGSYFHGPPDIYPCKLTDWLDL